MWFKTFDMKKTENDILVIEKGITDIMVTWYILRFKNDRSIFPGWGDCRKRSG